MASTKTSTRKNSTKTTPAVKPETTTPETTPAPAPAPAPKAKKEKKPRFVPLPADRAAWVAANARPAVSRCLCGCGGETKGRFVPGHDATLKEALKAGVEAGCEDSKAALATFGW